MASASKESVTVLFLALHGAGRPIQAGRGRRDRRQPQQGGGFKARAAQGQAGRGGGGAHAHPGEGVWMRLAQRASTALR
eukprot:359844-Chlamydomonas_euryale.AAC.3